MLQGGSVEFPGLLNFFRSFLPATALLLQPLMSMMKKKASLILGKEQQESFDKAKEALHDSVTLQHRSPLAQIPLYTDASGSHLRATLMQRESQDQP